MPSATPKLKIKLTNGATMPTMANIDDACYDIYSLEEIMLSPQRRAIVRTGLILDIPKGYMVELRPRSGLAANFGLTILNTPATIDSGYKDEVLIIMYNSGMQPYKIIKNHRIAQMRLIKLDKYILEAVDEVDKSNDREGGLGSTGDE